MSEYAANLVASLRAGARLGPNEAARAVLPLAEALATEHAHGMVRGSLDPAYVAPEVARGEMPTAATDVWSVGALLFHALAGHTPFEHSEETPARLRRGGWLAPLVEMTLSPDPAARPEMTEVAAYLRAREPVPDEPEPTVQLPAPPPPPDTATTTHLATGAPGGRRRERRTAIMALVLAAVVVTLGLITAVLVLDSHHDDSSVATPPRASSHPPTSPSPTATTRSTKKPTKKPRRHHHRQKRPTAAELTSFARTYVATASSNPSEGYRMLTSDYQRASPDYRQFWSAVRDPRILSVHADPKAMTVSYRYAYSLPGQPNKEESVTLRLVRQGKRLLISGAS